MNKLIRTLVTALAAVVVAGTVASAAPSFRSAFDVDPATEEVSPSPEVSPAPEPSESPEPEPTEAPEVEPTEAPSPEPGETSSPETPEGDDVEGDSAAPDFSACVGLTGLENAICRHEALLALQPENPGLANALEHLVANLAKHGDGDEAPDEDGTTDDDGSTDDGSTGDSTEGDGSIDGGVQASSSPACPGKSCESHGHGKANGHTKH